MRLPGGWSGTAFIFAYSAHSFRIRFAYPDAVLLRGSNDIFERIIYDELMLGNRNALVGGG